MVIWHFDRWLRSGPLCALATFLLPAAIAVPVARTSDVENILGLLLVAALVIGVGSAAGSAPTTGFGMVLFAFGSYLAEVPAALLGAVGIVLFAALVLHDLAGVFHRAPTISAATWKSSAFTVAAVVGAAAIASSVMWVVATADTWRAIVVPFGVAAVGFGLKLAADSHAKSAAELTKKRPRESVG